MAQWHVSLTHPDTGEFCGFLAIDLDWPEEIRHHHDGISAIRFDALFMGPVPTAGLTPQRLAGRFLVDPADVYEASEQGPPL